MLNVWWDLVDEINKNMKIMDKLEKDTNNKNNYDVIKGKGRTSDYVCWFTKENCLYVLLAGISKENVNISLIEENKLKILFRREFESGKLEDEEILYFDFDKKYDPMNIVAHVNNGVLKIVFKEKDTTITNIRIV